MQTQMRRVRAKGVEAVFVLAGAQRRERPVRPRAIHINEQKEETQMYAPTSQSPRVSLISIEVKVGFALMQRVGVWSVARIEKQGGCSASSEVQFLGVEMALTLSAPSLRTWRAACPTAPVWHGQSFPNQCAPHILAVDEQRATKPAKITLICTFGSGPARTCHAFKFYRCRIPQQLAQTRRCTFPDLTLCGARRTPGLGRIETD